MKGLVLSTVVFLTVSIGQICAAELRIVASGATQDALKKAMSDFEKSSSHRLDVTWAGAAIYRPLLSSDKPFDAVIIASADADTFIQSGKLKAPKAAIAKTGIGVGVKKGHPKPDISTSENVKAMLLRAQSVGYSMGPSGAYVEKQIAKLGIEDQVRPKLKQTKTGREVGKLVASGKVELGFQPISELVHADGVDFVGGLPSDIQSFTVYAFVTHSKVTDEGATQEFLTYLQSPAVQAAVKSAGMEQP